jgi:8-oxo-dGTP pyrophosphatase MutT (NUDIX family)
MIAYLIELLAAHEPADPKEAADLETMRRLAATLPDPFSRAQPEAHFTASAILVEPMGLRTCMVHHRALGRWLQPGGHFEESDGGSIVVAAMREAEEETGCRASLVPGVPVPLDVDVHEIPARGGVPHHLHLDLRVLLVASDPAALAHAPGESLGAEWLRWEDALARADEPALRRALRKAERYCGC